MGNLLLPYYCSNIIIVVIAILIAFHQFMSCDNLRKLLAEKYPLDFAGWLLTEEPQTVKVLKTQLSIEPIRADFVTFLQTENQILHLEFQT
ncbi:hypothetical protein [Trichormus azollae]|uniref:hypothetical protein n=1 Tax=Trichormus azollae TaxID=1164 RepID=UPI00325FDDEA